MDISVITPTRLRPDRMEWLHELNACVTEQGGQHVLVLDGQDAVTSSLDAVIVPTHRHIGQAAARNLGLLYADGDLITAADDDDLLPEGSLTIREETIDSLGVAWCAGQLAHYENGEITDVWSPPAVAGPYRRGEVFQKWSEPSGRFPIAPTGLMVRRKALMSIGGWAGLAQAEDFAMVLAVTGMFDGVVLDDVVYWYRQHAGQMLKSADFDTLEGDSRQWCWDRAAALSAVGWVRTED